MKIVIYGDANLPNTGGWFYAQSLEEMGHSVIRIDSDEGIDFYHQAIAWRLVHRLRGGPLEMHRKRHAESLVNVVARERPDIVLVLKGLHIGASDVDAMRSYGAWVAIINHDDFFSLSRSNWSHIQRSAIPHYDFVFATREVNVTEVAPLNPRVEFFPFAYYPKVHRPVEIPEQERALWDVDVVFVGTWEQERCGLLEQLVQRVPARYAIWGNLWSHVGSRSPLRPYIKGRDATGVQMAKALGGAKIALGFLRKKNRDDYTQRTFEIPACGGLLLAERTARHQAYFREGIEAEFFDPRRPEELVRKVELLLANERRRESIRQAGRAALFREPQTYEARMSRMLAVHRQARPTRNSGE